MKKIFLVEDDKTISKNLMLLLRSEGFAVSHASTQREAVDMLAEGRFDLHFLKSRLKSCSALLRA